MFSGEILGITTYVSNFRLYIEKHIFYQSYAVNACLVYSQALRLLDQFVVNVIGSVAKLFE